MRSEPINLRKHFFFLQTAIYSITLPIRNIMVLKHILQFDIDSGVADFFSGVVRLVNTKHVSRWPRCAYAFNVVDCLNV